MCIMKMKNLFLLLLAIKCFPVLSQDTVRVKKLFIGPLLSPDYTWASLGKINSLGAYYDSGLTGKFAFTGGLNLIFQISRRMSINIGVEYSERDIANRVTEMEYPYTQEWLKHNLNYLDLPIELNYYLCKKRRSFYLMTGISPSVFLFATENDWEISRDPLVDLYHPAQIGYGKAIIHSGVNAINAQLHCGLGYTLNHKESRFRIELVYRIGLSPANPPIGNDESYFTGSNMHNGAQYVLLNCSRTYYSCGLAFSYLWGL